jgi:hypothetical protein
MEGYSLILATCRTFLFRTFLISRASCAHRVFCCASHISTTPSVCVAVTPGHDKLTKGTSVPPTTSQALYSLGPIGLSPRPRPPTSIAGTSSPRPPAPSDPPSNYGGGIHHWHKRGGGGRARGRGGGAGQGGAPWSSLYNPWTGQITMWPSLSIGGPLSHPLSTQHALLTTSSFGGPSCLLEPSPSAPPALPQAPLLPHSLLTLHMAPSWMSWSEAWDQLSLANSFSTMTLTPPTAITDWMTNSGASFHTTPDAGILFPSFISFFHHCWQWFCSSNHLHQRLDSS